MRDLFYTGKVENWRDDEPISLPVSPLEALQDPKGYMPDEGLKDAANVALMLGQPLLLTGEPGTGKTQFAYNLARELGYGVPIKFETKSTTTATDLFYVFDAVRQFHNAASAEVSDASKYVRLNALGLAILRANQWETIKAYWPTEGSRKFDGPKRSVVLIDEIDKAPRDVPNDILNEIELMSFRIPEIDNNLVEASKEFRPILILTSNSEKHLPDAFLRRCVYYDIPFPDNDRLKDIVAKRIAHYSSDSRLLNDAISLFNALRKPVCGIRKHPGTAELLYWICALQKYDLPHDANLRDHEEFIIRTLSSVLKTSEDSSIAKQIVSEWIKAR